ncbi:glutathione S-transferase theta-1-like [Diadema antillarum]|uniref:glutathione S-transferase theta-1-like n=1 Tax=Diadema antillarum TaxID=105358 RepID=UPI003A86E16A
MVVTIYVDLLSQPCRALIVFLKNSKIPFELENVETLEGEQKRPEFQAINPMMRVPAMKDGDFCLSETVAIFRYLTAKYPNDFPDHWYPADIERRAKVDEYMAFHHQGVREPLEAVAVEEVWLPILTGKPISEEAVTKHLETARKKMAVFTDVWLKDRSYLLGDELSFADVLSVSELVQNTMSRAPVIEDNDAVKAYIARVRERLNPEFDEVFETIYKRRDNFVEQNKK